MTRIDPLDLRTVRTRLPSGFDGSLLHALGAVGSTNDEVRRLAEAGAPAGTAVVAEAQDRGRGRLGRAWYSPAGLGLYVSVLRRTSRPAEELGRYGLAAAAAAREACLLVSKADVRIKWPNDLVVRGRKLAGILAESWGAPGRLAVAVGLGVNVWHRAGSFPGSLDDTATSLAIEGPLDGTCRETILAAFLDRFGDLSMRLESGDWEPVRVRWQRGALPLFGRCVRWTGPAGKTLEARVIGITDRGTLELERFDGGRGEASQGESLCWME